MQLRHLYPGIGRGLKAGESDDRRVSAFPFGPHQFLVVIRELYLTMTALLLSLSA